MNKAPARSTLRRHGFCGALTLLLTSIAAVTFGGAAHAQTTDLTAHIDMSTRVMNLQIDAGEPLRSPVLSILFSPGVSVVDAPQVCLGRWHVERVQLAATDTAIGPGAYNLESRRFTCGLRDVSEKDRVDLTMLIEVSEAAADLPVSAAVGIQAGAIVLETVGICQVK